MFDYYPGPILVNFGSRGITAGHYFRDELCIEIAVGQSEMGAVGWWALGIGGGSVA